MVLPLVAAIVLPMAVDYGAKKIPMAVDFGAKKINALRAKGRWECHKCLEGGNGSQLMRLEKKKCSKCRHVWKKQEDKCSECIMTEV